MYDRDYEDALDTGPEHVEGRCSTCGEECVSETLDAGIGPYEYWGARGVDYRPYEASPCCEAEVVSEETWQEREAEVVSEETWQEREAEKLAENESNIPDDYKEQ